MISQETKDHIDRKIEAEAYKWDAYYQNEDSFIMPARLFRFAKHMHNQMLTKYAEKLEEKDKIIESKDKELMAMANITRQTELNLKLQVEAKETELAQLKEIAERMAKVIETWNKGGNYDAPNAFTAYAEWCKQINKAK